jgi:predicted DNA-binding transcriptional regulator AlpA
MPKRDLMTCSETADFLRLHESTLERMRGNGSGPPFIKLGPGKKAPVRYSRADVVAWIEKQRRNSTSEDAFERAIRAELEPRDDLQ